MKKWWLEKGWPWLKENWWVLLLLPVMALVAIGRYVHTKDDSVRINIDPLRDADERAKIEAQTRIKQLETEKKRLESELAVIQGRYEEQERSFNARLAARVDELRSDPDKLRQAMLSAGKK